jgi:hypothetical protein
MIYQLEFSGQANRDIDFHKKSGNKALLKKLFQNFHFAIIDGRL